MLGLSFEIHGAFCYCAPVKTDACAENPHGAEMDRTVLCKDRLLAAVIFCSLSAFIAMYLLLGLFAHPAADDYWFANKVINQGFLQSQVSWYTEWTGRYSSTAFISSYLAVFGLIEYFWVVPVLLLLATLASFSALFLSLPASRVKPFEAVSAGLILAALYISGVPSTSETFYWLAGGITYQLGNSLYLLLLVALNKLYYGSANTRKRAFLLASPLVLVIAGMNETVMLLQSLTIMLALCLAFKKPQQRHLFLSLLILSLLGAAVVITAPGNAIRSANFPLAGDLLFSVENSIIQAGTQVLSWSKAATLWLATLIWLPVASARMRASGAGSLGARRSVTAVFIWLSLLAAMYFPAFWSMGAPPPTRTLSTTYTVFIVGWFMTLTLIAASIPSGAAAFPAGAIRFVALALGGMLFATGNGTVARSDFAVAPTYSKQLKERYLLFAASKGAARSDIKVPALEYHPETIAIRFGDIGADREDWKNRNCADYFNLKSVSTVWKKQ